jgi:hypothetical protein
MVNPDMTILQMPSGAIVRKTVGWSDMGWSEPVEGAKAVETGT